MGLVAGRHRLPGSQFNLCLLHPQNSTLICCEELLLASEAHTTQVEGSWVSVLTPLMVWS